MAAGIIRIIGDPAERYREDPVRMLRVLRFAARLGSQSLPRPRLRSLITTTCYAIFRRLDYLMSG